MPRSSESNVSREQLSRPGDWYAVSSSRVAEMRYDPGLRAIDVVFVDGTPWTYNGVDEGLFDRFRSSESPGRFINNVLNSFPHHRGGFDYASHADTTDEEA
jgi:hypothetical protein